MATAASLIATGPAFAQEPVKWAGFGTAKLALLSDTSKAFRSARTAQEAFELSRVWALPVTQESSGRCDERIGRFCYWYDEGDTTLPREPEPVKQARARLLLELESAGRARPDNGWIVGQRVRYLVEHQQYDSAAAVVAPCPTVSWWCDALLGFALHVGERFAPADSAFARALATMPRDLRCDWTDWSKLLEDQLHARYDRLDCEDRQALADTLFRLGQPFLARPGNDFRTELLSRRVMSLLVASSRSPQQLSWGRDVDELSTRYGWPVRWSRADRHPMLLEEASVVGHERSPAYSFFPSPSEDSLAPWDWDLKPARPRARYAPSYADLITELPRHQVARFPRGDSTIVVAAIDVTGDTLLSRATTTVGLGVVTDWNRPPDLEARPGPALGAVRLTTAGTPLVIGIEAWNGRRFGRAREACRPIDRTAPLVVSDLLIFKVSDELPQSIDQAAARALGAVRFARTTPVGIYWEVTGQLTDSVAVSVSVVPRRRSLLGRVGQGLSLVKRRAPLTLQWTAPGGGREVGGRAFELDLRRLRPGAYRLRLEVTSGGATAATERSLDLEP